MSKFKLSLVTMLAASAVSWADVSVNFNNTIPTGPSPGTDAGVITLDFSVDGSGNVTLDASTTATDAGVIAAVDAWDGAAGTVSYAGAYSTAFSLIVDKGAGSPLKISSFASPSGLGIGGMNQWKVDNYDAESIKATASISGASIDFKTVDYSLVNLSLDPVMKITGPQGVYTNAITVGSGTMDFDADSIFINDGKNVQLANASSNGYTLVGFTFDVIEEVPEPGVTVTFTNSNPNAAGPPFAENTPGTITLDYTVDALGFVTVDASCSETNATIVAAVDAWDGSAGYLEYTNSVSFSVEVVSAGGTLRVSDAGSAGGLGVTGQNQWRIDRTSESVKATLQSLPGVAMKIKNVEWVNGQSTAGLIELDASSGTISNTLTVGDGAWNVIADDIFVNNDEALSFGVTTNIGYSLKSFEFVLADEYVAPPTPGVDVEFLYAGANMNFGTGESLSLDFSINGSGVVSLDASTSNTNATQIAAADAWDSSDVGFITNSALFGKTFTLTGNAANELGAGAITLWSNDGGILGVSGQNAGRIDGANVPTGTNNLESLTWAMSGDVTVDFTSFAHGNTHTGAGGVELTDSDTTELIDYSVTGSPVDISSMGFSVGAGQSLTFSAVTNFLEGAGIAGFSFDISAAQALTYATWSNQYSLVGGMTDDDDNDGVNNLYEFAVGGNPINGTVAPAYMPTSTLVDIGGSSYVIEYVYTRRHPVPVDMQYYCEVDTQGLNFPNWQNSGYTELPAADAAAGFKTVTNTIPVDVNATKFIKLVVEQN